MPICCARSAKPRNPRAPRVPHRLSRADWGIATFAIRPNPLRQRADVCWSAASGPRPSAGRTYAWRSLALTGHPHRRSAAACAPAGAPAPPADRAAAGSRGPAGAARPGRRRRRGRRGRGSRAPRNARGLGGCARCAAAVRARPGRRPAPRTRHSVRAGCPAGSTTMRQPAGPAALEQRRVDRRRLGCAGRAADDRPVDLPPGPAANAAWAACSAARRSATTRQPAVSASSRCASQGPSRRRDSCGKQSSTLGAAARARMHRQAGGLVQHDEAAVLEQDRESMRRAG